MIDSLTKSKRKDFKYKNYEVGNHSLSKNDIERDNLIINWFKTHSK